MIRPGGKTPRFQLSLGEGLALARLLQIRAWPLGVIVVLGVLSSIAESLGVSLVVLFLYAAMGQTDAVHSLGGTFGRVLQQILAVLPSPSLVAPMVLVMMAAKVGFTTCHGLLSARMQSHLGEAVRNRLHAQYLYVDYGYVRSQDQGRMLSLLAEESWAVSSAYGAVTRLLVSLAYIAVTATVLLAISWPLTLTAAGLGTALFASLSLMARPARRLGLAATEANQTMAEKVLHVLQGMRTIRAFAQEAAHQQRFEAASAQASRVSLRTQAMFALLSPMSELGYVLILIAVALLARHFHTPFAATLAVVALLYRLQGPLKELQNGLLSLAQLEAPLERIGQLLRKPLKDYAPHGASEFEGLETGIRFDDVSFAYGPDGQPVLKSVSFDIPAGKRTAIVGASGAGKTTIINLLLRLDEPCQGRILVDGRPLASLRREDWLQRLALAGQDVELMESTVRENITVADAKADTTAVLAAARTAGIMPLIEALPEGLDHWIGAQGANFSGGQRQRLGLARAILRRPQVLILDEATSALDALMEDSILAGLDGSRPGQTTILITHRLTAVLDVDHLIVLEDGVVVESGAPRQLLMRPESHFKAMLAPFEAETRMLEA